MRAVTCTEAKLRVEEVPDPVPGRGQVLINVVRCGICGSDLHARLHCDDLAELARQDPHRPRQRRHDPLGS